MSSPSIYYDAVSELSPVSGLLTLFITNKTQVPETRFEIEVSGVETVESFRRDLATKLKQDPDLIQLMWGDELFVNQLIPLDNLMATLDSCNITNKSDIVVINKEHLYVNIVGQDQNDLTYMRITGDSNMRDLASKLRSEFPEYKHDIISVIVKGNVIAISDLDDNTTTLKSNLIYPLTSNHKYNRGILRLRIQMRIVLQSTPAVRNRISPDAPVFFNELIYDKVSKLKKSVETSWGIPYAEQILTDDNGTPLSDDIILYTLRDTAIHIDVLSPPPPIVTRTFLRRSGGTPPPPPAPFQNPFQNSIGSKLNTGLPNVIPNPTFVPWQPMPLRRMSSSASPPPSPPPKPATKLRRTGGRRRTTKKRKNNRKSNTRHNRK